MAIVKILCVGCRQPVEIDDSQFDTALVCGDCETPVDLHLYPALAEAVRLKKEAARRIEAEERETTKRLAKESAQRWAAEQKAEEAKRAAEKRLADERIAKARADWEEKELNTPGVDELKQGLVELRAIRAELKGMAKHLATVATLASVILFIILVPLILLLVMFCMGQCSHTPYHP